MTLGFGGALVGGFTMTLLGGRGIFPIGFGVLAETLADAVLALDVALSVAGELTVGAADGWAVSGKGALESDAVAVTGTVPLAAGGGPGSDRRERSS